MSEIQKLRVANFNIKHGALSRKRSFVGRPALLAAACAEIDADILALQEVDHHVWRSGFCDLLQAAAGTTYSDHAFGKAMGMKFFKGINPLGSYGLGLLVKGTIKSQEIVELEGDYVRMKYGKRRNITPEPRIATFSEVETQEGMTVSVANTHFGGPLRKEFVRSILTNFTEYPEPRILLGDFNTGHSTMQKWLGVAATSLQLAPQPSEFPISYKQSDHIAVSGFSIDSVTSQRFPVSDHPAIITELGNIEL